MSTEARTKPAHIAALNDALRHSLSTTPGGQVVFTPGIRALIGDVAEFACFHRRAELIRLISAFDAFDESNDPHGERDFGVFTFAGEKCFWKIDYYDRAVEFHSPDPADPAVTVRVLTVMLAEEY